jgi:TolA-binding protein
MNMNKRIRHINDKPGEKIRYKTRNGFENDLLADSDDSALFEKIGDYMKGCLDIDDVKSDPGLTGARETVAEIISDYSSNLSGNKENEKFIRGIFMSEGSGAAMNDEIKFIRQEIDDNKLNEITAEWVREWHQKKQSIGIRDQKTKEISDFITGAINTPETEPVKSTVDTGHKSAGKRLFIRYAAVSAAAMLGVFLLIGTLLHSSDPGKLFDAYYKPFDAISPVTRSVNNNVADNYAPIESFKTGHYQEAAAGFGAILQKDPSQSSSKFFLGLSQLALKNYDQAVNMLSAAANEPGEYGKEAKWYLGLTYLKMADKIKAAECFEALSKSDGFYRERSEKILRRLR